MKKTICFKCNNEFSNNNIEKHFNSCDGNYPFKKSTHCKHCEVSWDELGLDVVKGEIANHIRWCKDNPMRYAYTVGTIENVKSMNLAKLSTGYTNQFSKAKLLGNHIESHLKGKPHPKHFGKHKPESIELIRQKALQSTHRRLRKGVSWYNGVMMDSSWEVALAKRLDELGIRWNRPDPLKWTDSEGRVRNYFPDFYLLDYNLFLDPKNKAAYENQKHKIEILKKTYTNVLFILTLAECKNFSL